MRFHLGMLIHKSYSLFVTALQQIFVSPSSALQSPTIFASFSKQAGRQSPEHSLICTLNHENLPVKIAIKTTATTRRMAAMTIVCKVNSTPLLCMLTAIDKCQYRFLCCLRPYIDLFSLQN